MLNYIYYLLSRFTFRFNNRDGDYAFTALFYILLFSCLNIMTLCIFFVKKAYFVTNIKLIIFICLLLPVSFLYFKFLHNNKYIRIIEEYNEKMKDKPIPKISIVLILVYVLLTFFSIIYFSIIGRSKSF